MRPLTAVIEGIGLIGPGLDGWAKAQAILRGEVPFVMQPATIPAPTVLPPAERRRTGTVVKLALGAGLAAIEHAGLDAAQLATVFASSGADGDNCHAICEALASSDRLISPTRFHNSVHNAPAGYWGIATGATAPATVLCAYDASLGAGLLEAVSMAALDGVTCVLIAYDTAYPEPLHSTRRILGSFALGLVIGPEAGARNLGRITVTLSDAPADTLGDTGLEALRCGIPTARALPLLAALASGGKRRVVLDYLAPQRIAVEVAA